MALFTFFVYVNSPISLDAFAHVAEVQSVLVACPIFTAIIGLTILTFVVQT